MKIVKFQCINRQYLFDSERKEISKLTLKFLIKASIFYSISLR